MKQYLFSAMAILFLCSCGGSRTASSVQEKGDTISLHYAQLLTLIERGSELEITIRSPKDSTLTLQHIFLQTPVQKAAVFSSIHCALLEELGCKKQIGGICDTPFCHLPFVEEGLSDNTIQDLGNSMDPNIERVVDLQPDLILTTPYEGNNGYGRLERLGIPLVPCADYMETGPLARAEWMKFYGRLFGKARDADSLFAQVEQKYLLLKKKAASSPSRPRLLFETPQNGMWYVSGGESCSGILYRDAGADYLFADLATSGSMELSLEYAMEKALTADVWLTKHHGPLSRKQLETAYPVLSQIKAPLWVCDTSQKLYFEQTSFHPEVLLEEIVHILHPELGIEAEFTYFCPQE